MKRDIAELTERDFDVVIVGGGIFGICIAWDAALRGLSVALVERGDFAEGTSAECFKIVHGGIRYLQHLDLARIRESSSERRALLRIAPHQVRPLPIVVPTYGHGLQGKELLSAGACLYDLLVLDRNRGIRDSSRRVPWSRVVSRAECLSRFPGLDAQGLTGGVLFHDAQMYNPPRLALSFLRSAVEDAGVSAANYVEARGFLERGNRIVGVRARDVLTGEPLEVRGRVVVNAAGAWAEGILKRGLGMTLRSPSTFSRDACFVVRRTLGSHALAVRGWTRDPDALLSRNARHLFLVPWRNYTIVGVWHVVHSNGPDSFELSEDELARFIDEVNRSYPALDLTLNDVTFANAGLVLFGENQPGAVDLSYGKRSRVVDHKRSHGIDGLITVIGVRYTTARSVAERIVRRIFRKLDLGRAPQSKTADTPIHGGDVSTMDDLISRLRNQRPHGLTDAELESLARNYGSEYGRVLAYADEDSARKRTIERSHVTEAEVVHAVREEMAVRLGDVLFRRTDLATGEHPGDAAIETCARLMASELGWSRLDLQEEIDHVTRVLDRHVSRTPTAVGES